MSLLCRCCILCSRDQSTVTRARIQYALCLSIYKYGCILRFCILLSCLCPLDVRYQKGFLKRLNQLGVGMSSRQSGLTVTSRNTRVREAIDLYHPQAMSLAGKGWQDRLTMSRPRGGRRSSAQIKYSSL